jgi:hypothetical protein
MYFASIRVPEGILRLENDFRTGKPWVRIYMADGNGQVDWKNSLFMPLTQDEIIQLYNLVINNIQDVFTINKQNSSLTISLGPQIEITITYNQSLITVYLSEYSQIVQFEKWVRFSVEQFPGLEGLFQDLLYVIKPEYFEERKREMEQWKAKNGYGNTAYNNSGYGNTGYNQPYNTGATQPPPANNAYKTPNPTYNKPTYNANITTANKSPNQTHNPVNSQGGYRPPTSNQPAQGYRQPVAQAYTKPNPPAQDDWTNSFVPPDEE